MFWILEDTADIDSDIEIKNLISLTRCKIFNRLKVCSKKYQGAKKVIAFFNFKNIRYKFQLKQNFVNQNKSYLNKLDIILIFKAFLV